MDKIKINLNFSEKHKTIGKATETALKKVSEKLIKEKKENSYLIIADENGYKKT